MKKILVVNDYGDMGSSYGRPFTDFATVTTNMRILKEDPESILAAVFTGGADVDPSIYGHERYVGSFCQIDRDIMEQKVFKELVKLGIPLFGICRGSQFLCAMAGGTLVQHLDKHGGVMHTMRILDEDRVITVNSTHHQMQVPPEGANVIGVAEPRRSDRYIYNGNKDGFVPDYEYEVVHYPNINALGAQYHPESMNEESEGWTYYQSLIERHLNNKIVPVTA